VILLGSINISFLRNLASKLISASLASTFTIQINLLRLATISAKYVDCQSKTESLVAHGARDIPVRLSA